MKRVLFLLSFCMTEMCAFSQSRTVSVFYGYDNAGNCVLRSTGGRMGKTGEFKETDSLKVQITPSLYMETEFSINVNKDKDVHYILSDVEGHLKAEGTIENGVVIVNVSGFRRGLYLLRVYDNYDVVEYKMIKR